jgi:osmotically inducible lipoprotein OsmB
MWKPTILLPASAAALLLAGCGTSTLDRAESGAVIGAATGAVVGGLAGGVAAPIGAAVGAGVGATAGAVTDANTVNLGPPLWQRGGENQSVSASPQSTTASAAPQEPSRTGSERAGDLRSRIGEDTIKAVQSKMRTAGLYKGQVDGIVGPKTRDAVEQYQSQAGLQQSGRLDQRTLAKLIDVEGTQNAKKPEQGNGGTAAGTTQQ